METVSSTIWTRLPIFIHFNDKHYPTPFVLYSLFHLLIFSLSLSLYIYIYIYKLIQEEKLYSVENAENKLLSKKKKKKKKKGKINI